VINTFSLSTERGECSRQKLGRFGALLGGLHQYRPARGCSRAAEMPFAHNLPDLGQLPAVPQVFAAGDAPQTSVKPAHSTGEHFAPRSSAIMAPFTFCDEKYTTSRLIQRAPQNELSVDTTTKAATRDLLCFHFI